jgi:hypothetical protein
LYYTVYTNTYLAYFESSKRDSLRLIEDEMGESVCCYEVITEKECNVNVVIKYTVTRATQNVALLWKVAVIGRTKPPVGAGTFCPLPILVYYIPSCRKYLPISGARTSTG